MQLSNFFTHMWEPVYNGKGLSMARDEKSQDAIASSLGWESHEHSQECVYVWRKVITAVVQNAFVLLLNFNHVENSNSSLEGGHREPKALHFGARFLQ